MDEFEELKHQLLMAIQLREEIPQDVRMMIEGIFRKIEEIYVENHCYSGSISEALNIELSGVEKFLNNNITNSRRNEQFQEMQFILGQIERTIDEEQSLEGKISGEELEGIRQENNNRHSERFNEFGKNTIIGTVNNILGHVEEILGDINLRQRRSLSAREVNDDRIEEISYEVRGAIRRFMENGDQMIAAFEDDDNKFRDIILRKYMEYTQAAKESREKAASAMPEEGISPQQVFRDSLNAGITLVEQAANAETFKTREAADDELAKLIEELPESEL